MILPYTFFPYSRLRTAAISTTLEHGTVRLITLIQRFERWIFLIRPGGCFLFLLVRAPCERTPGAVEKEVKKGRWSAYVHAWMLHARSGGWAQPSACVLAIDRDGSCAGGGCGALRDAKAGQ